MNLKKIKSKFILFNIALILSWLAISCASTSKKEVSEDSSMEQNENESKETKKKSKKKSKKNKKSEQEDTVADDEIQSEDSETESSKSEDDKNGFIGWIDSDSKQITYEKGIIRLKALPALGSFNISALTPTDKAIPVLSSTNEYASSSFYLQADKKIYRLTADSTVKTTGRKTDNGITLYYNIKNVADVVIDFSCFSSDEYHDVDMIKISAEVTNLSTRKTKFALKAVLDTVLGESYRNHFYTTDGSPIKNEVLFVNSIEEQNMERWIISRNVFASLQIFLKGSGVSKVEQVQLANYQTLDTTNWYPNLLTYRTFDTVRSYNNSAVGIIWPSSIVVPSGKTGISFFMALALDEVKPNGSAYVFPEDEEFESISIENPSENKLIMKSPAFSEEVVDVNPYTVTMVETIEPAPTPTSDTVDIPVVIFDVAALTPEQLEPEYIQNLINRITVLEESGLAVNRSELLQLNAELDAILEILRQN